MAEIPNPTPKIKGGLNKFKGLPPWAYIAAIGVGGMAIWFGISRGKANAESTAADVTGDYSTALAPSSGGEAYPVGSQGAGYYYDPTTSAVEPDNESRFSLSDLTDFFAVVGYPGGGTQPSSNPVDHYVPPTVTVNLPPEAFTQSQPAAPPAPAKGVTASPAKDPCVGEYPFLQDNGSRKGQCYKVVKKDGKSYRYYKNGDKVLA